MFRILWKVFLLILILFVLSLIIKDSVGFDWSKFSYIKKNQTENVIKIGFIAPLSGPASLVGVKSLSAAKLAVDEINSDGGIYGKVVKLLVEDGKCTNSGGFEASQKLITEGVVGIVGGLCSSESFGLIDPITLNKVPTISFCSSDARLSGISDYFFRVYPPDSRQAEYAANYIKNNLGINNISIVYLNNDWGINLKDTFVKSYEKEEGNIISEYNFNNNDYNFDTIWSSLREDKPDLVYFIGFDKDTISALNKLTNKDNFILFGTYFWDDDNIWDSIDLVRKKIMFTVVNYQKYNPIFIENMKKRGLYSIYSCIPQAYDAVKILTNAIKMSDIYNTSDTNVLQQIKNTKYTGSASGVDISFDEFGDIISSSFSVKTLSF